jgi:hypothetical protein
MVIVLTCLASLSYCGGEVGVPQSLVASQTPTGVDLQTPSHQGCQLTVVFQLFAKRLQLHHLLDALQALVSVLVVYCSPLVEHLAERVLGLFGHPPWKLACYLVYHIDMVDVVVDGEEEVPGGHLHEDAAQGPHVAGVVPPAALQDDLRSTVLPSINDAALRIPLVVGSSKIYQLDPGAFGEEDGLPIPFLLRARVRTEQNVFWFEVGVGVAAPVHEGDRLQQLSGE